MNAENIKVEDLAALTGISTDIIVRTLEGKCGITESEYDRICEYFKQKGRSVVNN